MQQQIKGKALLILQNKGLKYIIILENHCEWIALSKESTNRHYLETP